MLQGAPIGSLLFLVRPAPAKHIQLGNITIDSPKLTYASYLVDRQQRLTTFLNVFNPVNCFNGDFALGYDLRFEPFRICVKK